MLLVIDVGNTNTVMGIYEKDILVRDWRIRTERKTTEDEFNVIFTGLFASGGIAIVPSGCRSSAVTASPTPQ